MLRSHLRSNNAKGIRSPLLLGVLPVLLGALPTQTEKGSPAKGSPAQNQPAKPTPAPAASVQPPSSPVASPTAPAATSEPARPQATGLKTSATENALRVEYFGADSGYAVGTNSVTFLCVVRNMASVGMSEGAAKLRCLPVSGLDYTTGNLTPRLPALAPNQAVAFRWRLVPLDKSSPLIAALLVERGEVVPVSSGSGNVNPPTPAASGTTAVLVTPPAPSNAPQANTPDNSPANALAAKSEVTKTEPPSVDAPPVASQTILTVVPRLRSSLSNNAPMPLPGAAPDSAASDTEARVGNDVVALRMVRGQSANPVFILSAREGNDWQTLAQSPVPLSVYAGEEGQRPWWEAMRWQSARAQNKDGEATLTLTGRIGSRWRSELIFQAHRNTCVIDGKLRLKALRSTRLYAIQPLRLLATIRTPNGDAKADGSPALVPAENGLLADKSNVSAWHEGLSTFGLTWPTTPRDGWQATRTGSGDISRLPILGTQWNAPASSELIPSGEIVEIPFRIFGFAPSETLRDASRFILP